MNPAVVVVAYNRPVALRRLLDSLAAATYVLGEDVPLVISIDRGEGPDAEEVARLAEAFEWRFGPKQVIRHDAHRGLIAHFRECGRLSQTYGAVIILEDDLVVAPPYHAFAAAALERYGDDARIAGVCLYGLWFNGFTHEPFVPIEDGIEVFFLRLPYTQGLCFTAAQWAAFEAWPAGTKPSPHPDLPDAFLHFGPEEWFPALAAYLAANERYFCFPRVSLTTGWGDAGTHFVGTTSWLQTPLQLRATYNHLTSFDDALAVYDAFYELLPQRLRALVASLPDLAFDVDLNATKQPANLHHEHVLTTRPVRRAIATYGLAMRPPELNLIYSAPGSQISLAHRDDVHWDGWSAAEARGRLEAYAWSRHRPSRRRALRFALARWIGRLRGRFSKPG